MNNCWNKNYLYYEYGTGVYVNYSQEYIWHDIIQILFGLIVVSICVTKRYYSWKEVQKLKQAYFNCY